MPSVHETIKLAERYLTERRKVEFTCFMDAHQSGCTTIYCWSTVSIYGVVDRAAHQDLFVKPVPFVPWKGYAAPVEGALLRLIISY